MGRHHHIARPPDVDRARRAGGVRARFDPRAHRRRPGTGRGARAENGPPVQTYRSPEARGDQAPQTRGDEARADAAKANQRANEAAERAAALEKEAAETRLQYEKLKAAVAWRIIEPNNTKRLVKRLSERPSVVQLEYVQGDPEAQRL